MAPETVNPTMHVFFHLFHFLDNYSSHLHGIILEENNKKKTNFACEMKIEITEDERFPIMDART